MDNAVINHNGANTYALIPDHGSGGVAAVSTWDSIVEQTPMPFALACMDSLEIKSANAAFRRLCHEYADSPTLQGLLGSAWVNDARRALHHEKLTEWGAECTINASRGDLTLWVDAFIVRLRPHDAPGVALLIKDVTARRSAENEVARLEMSVMHLSRDNTISEMCSMISHELNQPLTAILNYADTCRHMIATDRVRKAEMDDALACIEQLTDRTSRILDRIRRMVGRKEAAMKPLEPNAVVRDALSLAEIKLRLSCVAVETHLADDLPLITGDVVQLQQILLNLLLNAIDAMECSDDPAKRCITVSTARNDDMSVCIAVADNGPGLSAAVRDNPFGAFVTTKTQGLGIGLSICRRLAQAHGGRVDLRAREPRGVIAELTLPPRKDVEDG